MAELDISERRRPQDGKLHVRLHDRLLELRLATIPTAGSGNEDVVLRLLTARKPLPLEDLEMTERNRQALQQLLTNPYGLILCVGPTGAGKTTTLHAIMAVLNTRERKIWTAEDPVELTQAGLRQVQVNQKIGVTFATALRAFLRADPDVMMIGEIRDHETAEVCLQASLTGHLVLSTLHTNSTVETITRLLDMGMDPFNFADALLGVLAQRLARTLCAACKTPYHPSRVEYDMLVDAFGDESGVANLGLSYNEQLVLYRATKCSQCHQTGYKGRVGLHELLVVTDELRAGIHERKTAAELFHMTRAQGMTTLMQDGILKVFQGLTDYHQIKAITIR
jgi:type II secretory ATPase GspE/PulE/Tfp pilus assembly ATPase PilB-like protein